MTTLLLKCTAWTVAPLVVFLLVLIMVLNQISQPLERLVLRAYPLSKPASIKSRKLNRDPRSPLLNKEV